MVLNRLNKLVQDLNDTTKRTEKENILSQYIQDKEIKDILYFLYNKYIVTGISEKKILRLKSSFISTDEIKDEYNIFKLLDYIKIHNTGSDEDLKEVLKCIIYNKDYAQLIIKLITKDLKLGIQASTLNKVFGDNFIPTFDVMLAQKYFDDPDKLLPDGTEFILTTKLDGVRCVLINNSITGPKFYSRQGQLIEQLVELEEEARNLPYGFVYDGELLLDNKLQLDSKDLYRATVKVTSADKDKQDLIFNVFDMLPLRDFQNGFCDKSAEQRKHELSNIINPNGFSKFKFIKEVDILYQGDNKKAIEEHLERITNQGGEGIMINIANAPYECKRSKNLLKVKKMQTADVRVIALEPGTGKNYNKLGALRVEFIGPDGNIYTCSVGSGLSDEDRLSFWNHPELIEDKIIEIQYFEISSNQNGGYGLRFPVYKYIRDDKTEISMY